MFEDSSSYTTIIEELERQSQMFLARAVDATRTNLTCCVAPMWTWGDVAATILRTASEENCDLIILGSRPLKRWKPHLLGGACSTVAAKAPQPVLIVKPSFLLPLDGPLWRRILGCHERVTHIGRCGLLMPSL